VRSLLGSRVLGRIIADGEPNGQAERENGHPDDPSRRHLPAPRPRFGDLPQAVLPRLANTDARLPPDKRGAPQEADIVQERKRFTIGNDTPQNSRTQQRSHDFSVGTQFGGKSL
jgi:hypothetical protein